MNSPPIEMEISVCCFCLFNIDFIRRYRRGEGIMVTKKTSADALEVIQM